MAKKKAVKRKIKKIKRTKKAKVLRKVLIKQKNKRRKNRRRASVKLIKRKNRSPVLVKKSASTVSVPFSAKTFFKAKIKVIGIGGGGGSIVSDIGRSLSKASFVIADTDSRILKKKRGIKYFLFGQKLTRGLGSGMKVELAKMAAEQEKKRIATLFKGQDIVIFVASLGGGVGSGATDIFVEAAKDFGGIAFGIFTLPFKFEGGNKRALAAKSLKILRKNLNVSIIIPNERIFKIIGNDTPITEAFSIVNKNLAESLESLIDLIYNPGVINIDFADLRAILKGAGNSAFLNVVEASGKNRAEETIQKILNNPLYESGGFIVEKILFNIAGGGNLSMFEVDKISRAIAGRNPKAKIIFGISKNSKYKNHVKTTLLMTGPLLGAEKEEIEKVKKVKVISEKTPKAVKTIKSVKSKKTAKKLKKHAISKQPLIKEPIQEKTGETVFGGIFSPSFDIASQDIVAKKLSITDVSGSEKKAIRRTALEVKKEQEEEARQKTEQEKEWEIPAFLRKIKFKP